MRRPAALFLLFVASCTQERGLIDPPVEQEDPPVPSEWNLDAGPPSSTPPPKSATTMPPDFGPTVQAAKPPPPLSGGTLAISRDGKLAIAADPDRDQVHLAKLTELGGTSIALNAGDEPGRVVEDNNQRAHVVLRRGGAVVTIDLATHTLLSRRSVCPAPRGIAYDGKIDSLYIACAGGELVTLPAGGGVATRTLRLERDLRDVVLTNGHLFVSTFRTAQLLEIAAEGKVTSRRATGEVWSLKDRFVPRVAWRTLPDPLGGVVMLHQRSRTTPVSTDKGGYSGSFCGTGIVQGTLTQFDEGTTAPRATASIQDAVLSIDAAFSPDGKQIAIVNAGNAHTPYVQEVIVVNRESLNTDPNGCTMNLRPLGKRGEVTAVAWTPDGKLVTQLREPAMLYVGDVRIPLSGESRADTGLAIFHANSGAGIACASCHPEGGDDGHVWDFSGIGPRRTQTFRGGLLGTEPLHWDGDMKDIPSLVNAVFVGRMAGIELDGDRLAALTRWLDAVPAIPQSKPLDYAAVTRGETLFKDADVGCAGCHSGAALTNNATVDVGTGKTFQVPTLRGIAWRAPFIHNGCAATLLDRFNPSCGGANHGNTSTLSTSQLSDLVAYLETL